ncbi:hypothetical protein B484DRAFT_114440 [Ochromonadaceae sp. CCMP2298]|nr:hypothetical protein B484DRAFT_114440 [Ochromonadaceae sp. CCMP2298]
MVCAALLLEFAAFAVFWALPSSGDAWRQQPKDLYLHVAACSPALLSSLCLASEYYVLHCHSSYFYEFPWDPSSRLSCLWLLLVALGCAAFYCRINFEIIRLEIIYNLKKDSFTKTQIGLVIHSKQH